MIGATTLIGGVMGTAVMYVIKAEIRHDREDVARQHARLDGRINTHEAGCTARQQALANTLTSMDHKLDRFEDKIDRLMGMPS